MKKGAAIEYFRYISSSIPNENNTALFPDSLVAGRSRITGWIEIDPIQLRICIERDHGTKCILEFPM
jgi:hypothetical protein